MLDAIDRQILEKLQQPSPESPPHDQTEGKKSPAPITHAKIAEQITSLTHPEQHISESTVTRRIEGLAAAGIFTGYAAILDPEKLGLDFMAFVHVKLLALAALEDFQQGILAIPSVLECFAISGRMDFQLKVVTRDRKSFYEVHNQLRQLPGVSRFETSIVLDEVKNTTALPLENLWSALPRTGNGARAAGTIANEQLDENHRL